MPKNFYPGNGNFVGRLDVDSHLDDALDTIASIVLTAASDRIGRGGGDSMSTRVGYIQIADAIPLIRDPDERAAIIEQVIGSQENPVDWSKLIAIEQIEALAEQGYDVTELRSSAAGTVELMLTSADPKAKEVLHSSDELYATALIPKITEDEERAELENVAATYIGRYMTSPHSDYDTTRAFSRLLFSMDDSARNTAFREIFNEPSEYNVRRALVPFSSMPTELLRRGSEDAEYRHRMRQYIDEGLVAADKNRDIAEYIPVLSEKDQLEVIDYILSNRVIEEMRAMAFHVVNRLDPSIQEAVTKRLVETLIDMRENSSDEFVTKDIDSAIDALQHGSDRDQYHFEYDVMADYQKVHDKLREHAESEKEHLKPTPTTHMSIEAMKAMLAANSPINDKIIKAKLGYNPIAPIEMVRPDEQQGDFYVYVDSPNVLGIELADALDVIRWNGNGGEMLRDHFTREVATVKTILRDELAIHAPLGVKGVKLMPQIDEAGEADWSQLPRLYITDLGNANHNPLKKLIPR
jgi:hypothetical protein